MVSPKDHSILSELSNFSLGLKEYEAYRIISTTKGITVQQTREMMSLRERLVRESGKFGSLITELTGKEKIKTVGKGDEYSYDMWAAALRIEFNKTTLNALRICIDYTDRARGKLEGEIEMGIRDKQGNVIGEPVKFSPEPPKAFIAHGGRSGILDKLREFIEALGIKPIIVELSPSRGMTVDEKVSKYIKDADFGIVLATKGGIIDTKGKETKQHPRLNVIGELERLRAAFPDKTILLLEKGVDLPSNISGLTHEPFVGQSMDRAFTAIARELTEMRILKAVKPQ